MLHLSINDLQRSEPTYCIQSINHLFVSDQWSTSKKQKEIDNKNR